MWNSKIKQLIAHEAVVLEHHFPGAIQRMREAIQTGRVSSATLKDHILCIAVDGKAHDIPKARELAKKASGRIGWGLAAVEGWMLMASLGDVPDGNRIMVLAIDAFSVAEEMLLHGQVGTPQFAASAQLIANVITKVTIHD